MPLGNFEPASQRYGKGLFPDQPDETGPMSPSTIQRILSGLPHYDPASARGVPIPLRTQMSPAQRSLESAAGPGEIAGGFEGSSLPFSARIGLGTGAAAGGIPPSPTGPAGGPSSVIRRMLAETDGGSDRQSAAAGGPGVGVMLGQKPQDMMLSAMLNAISGKTGTPEGYLGGDTAGYSAQDLGAYESS